MCTPVPWLAPAARQLFHFDTPTQMCTTLHQFVAPPESVSFCNTLHPCGWPPPLCRSIPAASRRCDGRASRPLSPLSQTIAIASVMPHVRTLQRIPVHSARPGLPARRSMPATLPVNPCNQTSYHFLSGVVPLLHCRGVQAGDTACAGPLAGPPCLRRCAETGR